jgi:transposase
MDTNELYKEVEALRERLAQANRETELAQQAVALERSKSDQYRKQVEDAQQVVATERSKSEGYLQQVKALSATVEDQRKKMEQQERRMLELLRSLRGKKREWVNPDQMLLFEIGDLEQLVEEVRDQEKQPTKRTPKKHGRRLIPDGLPQEIIEHTLPESDIVCPVDGKVMEPIRWEESKQLDYIPSKLKVIVHRRAVYACPEKHDQAVLVTAPKPPQPIEKGLATSGLLAQVVVSKFGDHLPGYRQEDIFSRHGVEIRRSTLYDWMSGAADLCLPLYQRMQQRVLESFSIHTDDTTVKLVDKQLRSTKPARFWCYQGDAEHPYAVYDFTLDRAREGPAKFLEAYQGYLQADAYSGYDGIYLNSGGAIQEVACWAHCRRYWYKAREVDPARSHWVIGLIQRLYDVERLAEGKAHQERRELRQKYSVQLLEELRTWMDGQLFLPKSPTGEAARYTRNQWEALNRYVEDGRLAIDNNAAERLMKPVAIGRKNWLFVGSVEAGSRAAVLMSLVASCKLNQVEPWAYLRDCFEKLAGRSPGDSLDDLLPDRWLNDHPSHRWSIGSLRQQERAT